MATLVLHHATLETPAEYSYSHPIPCAACGEVWDEDDHYKESWDYVGKLAYCTERSDLRKPSCHAVAATRSYRAQAADALRNKIDEAIEEMDEIAAELGGVELDENGDPRAELDDLLSRLPRFAAGTDTGYRGDCMLEQWELFQLQANLSLLLGMASGNEAPRVAMEALTLLSGAERRSEGKQ